MATLTDPRGRMNLGRGGRIDARTKRVFWFRDWMILSTVSEMSKIGVCKFLDYYGGRLLSMHANEYACFIYIDIQYNYNLDRHQ